MEGDCRIDQVTAERPQPRKCPLLVDTGKLAVSDDIGREYRRKLSGSSNASPSHARLARLPGRSFPLSKKAAAELLPQFSERRLYPCKDRSLPKLR